MVRDEQPSPRPPPAVRVSGGSAPVEPPRQPAPRGRGRGAAVLVAGLALTGGATALLQPPPLLPVEATLRLLPDSIMTSLGGVVVLLVDTDNRGPAVVVEDVVVRAEPVRQASTANGVSRIGAASRGGFAVLVQPDCGALSSTPGRFTGSLTVTLRTDAGARRDVVLDLGREPAVAARLASLCGG